MASIIDISFFCIRKILLIVFFSLSSICYVHGNVWYVAPDGSNHTGNGNGRTPAEPLQSIAFAFNTAAGPGDTIFVMDGVYRNSGFGNGSLDNGPAAYLNNSGEPGQPIVLTAYSGHQPVIEFDGAGGFTANRLSHVEISGFLIRGPSGRINEAEALMHRLILPRPNYYNGRGIAIWGPANHIRIHNNTVKECPASGIRINRGDYLTISHNMIYGNTRHTSAAESALVVADARSIDEADSIKIRIENNMVWDNRNLIPFYTPNPPDIGVPDYGTREQDYIIDGSGVYMTRNKDYEYGWFYLANNISFNNGINGLVVHRTDRAIVINNTSYMNGATPLESGRQSSSGITLNNAEHVRVYNNISWARYADDFALGRYGELRDVVLEANIIYGGFSPFETGYREADPRFAHASTDPEAADFSLESGSPAINAGLYNTYTPAKDFFGSKRIPESMDIGAVAYSTPTSIVETIRDAVPEPGTLCVEVYPNPTNSMLNIVLNDTDSISSLRIFDVLGRTVYAANGLSSNQYHIHTALFSSGLYLVVVEDVKRNISQTTVTILE